MRMVKTGLQSPSLITLDPQQGQAQAVYLADISLNSAAWIHLFGNPYKHPVAFALLLLFLEMIHKVAFYFL
jgi:hypothetical protein